MLNITITLWSPVNGPLQVTAAIFTVILLQNSSRPSPTCQDPSFQMMSHYKVVNVPEFHLIPLSIAYNDSFIEIEACLMFNEEMPSNITLFGHFSPWSIYLLLVNAYKLILHQTEIQWALKKNYLSNVNSVDIMASNSRNCCKNVRWEIPNKSYGLIGPPTVSRV